MCTVHGFHVYVRAYRARQSSHAFRGVSVVRRGGRFCLGNRPRGVELGRRRSGGGENELDVRRGTTSLCTDYEIVWSVSQAVTVSRLASVAEDQWGLVTRRQAEAAGVSRATLARAMAPGGVLERVAHGVYRLVGAPVPDHVELRAAWLQLAPEVPVWDRGGAVGASLGRVGAGDGAVVSHRSAAALFGLGHLPADVHEFTVAGRRQTRRPDVRLHVRRLGDDERVVVAGLPVTSPARIAADLLAEREDPESVGQVVADALRAGRETRAAFEVALEPLAARYGRRRGDGEAMLGWLLDLAGAGDAGVVRVQGVTTAAPAHSAGR